MTQGTKPLELAEVAEKLRIRETNFQNYIGRFLYQFWPIYCGQNKCNGTDKREKAPTSSRLQNVWYVWFFWFDGQTRYFRLRKLSDVEFWRISVDILTWRARYIHFSSLMVVKSFHPEATKMFDSLWCRGPLGPLQDILLNTTFLPILHLTNKTWDRCKIFYWKLHFSQSYI